MLWSLVTALLTLQLFSPIQQDVLFKDKVQTELITSVNTDKRWIALTFDDGPDPVETVKVLDVLHRYKARATFFIIGEQAEKYPEIIKRESLEGHELANHTYSHKSMRTIPIHELEMEINKTEKVIYSTANRHTRLFRPPSGFYTKSILKTVKKMGYTVVMWSWDQDSRDWRKPGVKEIADAVLTNAHPGDVVLFHDRISGKSQTSEALEIILNSLQNEGYQFVTVSDLLHARPLSSQ